MSLIERVDAVCDRWNVLRHSFYVRWERGELSRDELAYYAGEYRHAVSALVSVAETASTPAHGAEERSHVDLWDDFARSLGADRERLACAETKSCVEAWSGSEEPLAVLYAIESTQPAISRTKRDGLVRWYGFERDSEGTRYFDVHAERDLEHAAQTRERLGGMPREREDAVVAAAERALRGNWTLLDGVERYARAPHA